MKLHLNAIAPKNDRIAAVCGLLIFQMRVKHGWRHTVRSNPLTTTNDRGDVTCKNCLKNMSREGEDTFGPNLRKWRKNKNLSQRRVGLAVNASGWCIGDIERSYRRPSIALQDRIEKLMKEA